MCTSKHKFYDIIADLQDRTRQAKLYPIRFVRTTDNAQEYKNMHITTTDCKFWMVLQKRDFTVFPMWNTHCFERVIDGLPRPPHTHCFFPMC